MGKIIRVWKCTGTSINDCVANIPRDITEKKDIINIESRYDAENNLEEIIIYYKD